MSQTALHAVGSACGDRLTYDQPTVRHPGLPFNDLHPVILDVVLTKRKRIKNIPHTEESPSQGSSSLYDLWAGSGYYYLYCYSKVIYCQTYYEVEQPSTTGLDLTKVAYNTCWPAEINSQQSLFYRTHHYTELAVSSSAAALHLLTQRDGQAEWAWINTGMADLPQVVTNPSTGRARRS